MFVYIYVCKHQITYIILLIKCLQKKQLKRFSNIHVLMFIGFQFYKQPNILTSNINELSIKKGKETVKQHYKEK